MDNVNGWVRQARHRAKKYSVTNTLTVKEAVRVLDEYERLCAYCGGAADTMDHALPLGAGGPNVQANVLTSCRHCKFLKRHRNIVWMFDNGLLPERAYLSIIRDMLTRVGAEEMRTLLRRETGIVGTDRENV